MMQIGYKENGPGKYLILFPFQISPGSDISDIDPLKSYKLGKYEIKFEQKYNNYFMNIGPFESEQEAQDFFPKLYLALPFVSLKYTIGFKYKKIMKNVDFDQYPMELEKSNFTPNQKGPIIIEGSFYDSDPTLIPTRMNLTRFGSIPAKVTIGMGIDSFTERMSQAIEFSNIENLLTQNRLHLAIDLYCSSFYESSSNAKFISLVTVLEALVQEYPISSFAESSLKDARNTLKKIRNEYEKKSKEWEDIEHLISRIGNLKKQSIGKSIQIYLSEVLDKHGELGDSKEVSKKIRDIYNTRSELLHDGISDKNQIQEGRLYLESFLPKLLETLYIAAATEK